MEAKVRRCPAVNNDRTWIQLDIAWYTSGAAGYPEIFI